MTGIWEREENVENISQLFSNVWSALSQFIIWLAPRAGKMNQITRCDWLPERARCMEPSCPLGTTRCIPQAKFHQKQYNKSFIDQVCSVKMAGYWPRSFFCDFMDLDFVSVHKHAKKNLANLQPSWPHTGSITHTYDTDLASSWVLDQSECAQGANLIYIEIVNNKKSKQTGIDKKNFRNLSS